MFRATMYPSSGDLTVSKRHWYFLFCVGGCLAGWQLKPTHQYESIKIKLNKNKSDVWLTVHRNSVWIRKTN